MLQAAPGLAARQHLEAWYQARVCAELGGVCVRGVDVEVGMRDNSRCDILLGWAIEVDFDDNWAQSVGQSALYAALTGRPPGIVLVCENGLTSAMPYIARLLLALGDKPCAVWLYVGEGLLRVR